MTPSAEPGNLLVVRTGMIGCSAHHSDSKPRASAVRAMKPTSTLYAGRGTDTPTFIACSYGGLRCGDAARAGKRTVRTLRPAPSDVKAVGRRWDKVAAMGRWSARGRAAMERLGYTIHRWPTNRFDGMRDALFLLRRRGYS